MTVPDWFARSRIGCAVGDDPLGVCVKEPAPVGPQPLGCEPEGVSRVACWAARLDGVVWKVRARLLVTRGLFQRTWRHARIGHLRSQGCEACGRTAPRPTAATPRERAPHRTRMFLAIAELRRIVKNKVRTHLTHSVMVGLVPANHILRISALQRHGSSDQVRG